ncbi:hypothetical protein Esi_0000_0234 [Ectocarpus siliculosus]|uniref:Uncharacterized protein n=1 Tax=Ectocarpus siliculosus TaxID=2880 RepID=D8LB43_ECTSI|nr:hypothetical protein Esi_0000_0234 [Ectocarpus siliculosus]|eukprot:CBN76552.1 hypothetical protein Esi_0000_0234 [Ectocarpus siliculosus]
MSNSGDDNSLASTAVWLSLQSSTFACRREGRERTNAERHEGHAGAARS